MMNAVVQIVCACGNVARYMNDRGELCCGVCPVKQGIDSIKLADVPELLAWARKFINLHPEHPWQQSLRDIVQRAPQPKSNPTSDQ